MPERPTGTSALRELDIPPGAATAASAVEVLRAWIVDGELQVTIAPVFPSPDVWGVLLADVARRAARDFAAEDGAGGTEAMNRILGALEAELEMPTHSGTTKTAQPQ